jgi:hypothetical protein
LTSGALPPADRCVWCGAPSELRALATRAIEVLEGVGGELVRGEVMEVRRYLTGKAEDLEFGACRRCLARRRAASLAATMAPFLLVAAGAGSLAYLFSMAIVRGIYPPWALPDALDPVLAGIVFAYFAISRWRAVIVADRELRRRDPEEWAALLAKGRIARRLRAVDRALGAESMGLARSVVYAPKEYRRALETGIKP